MAKRWYLCPVAGSGTSASPYRASIEDLRAHWAYSSVIPSTAAGIPRYAWCLLVVSAPLGAHPEIAALPSVFALPALRLDTTLASLSGAQRNAIRTAAESRGIDTAGLDVSGSTTLRQIVRFFGRRLDTAFSERRTDTIDFDDSPESSLLLPKSVFAVSHVLIDE